MCVGVGIWTEKDNTRMSGEIGREEREEKGQREKQRRKASKNNVHDPDKGSGRGIPRKQTEKCAQGRSEREMTHII